MTWLRTAVLLCCLFEAGWMAFDGTRALITGDYITPKAGPRAGQLGPWHQVVQRLGVNPRGTPMKVFFAVYGIVWLLLAVAFLRGAAWAPGAMLVAAVGALWYLPVGTVLSLLQTGLLVVLRFRSG